MNEKIPIIVALFVCLTTALLAYGQPVFLMGEDIIGPRGLLLSVNDISREVVNTGLRGGRQKDRLKINFTMVNTGKYKLDINPLKDFSVTLRQKYPAVHEAGVQSLERPFVVHPDTQSRGDLLFMVDNKDTQLAPILEFRYGLTSLRVLCDKALANAMENSQNGNISFESGKKLVKFYMDYERFDEAKKVLEPLMNKYPYDAALLLDAAALEQKLGFPDRAKEYLNRLNPDSGLKKDEAIALARQAFDLGQYPLSQRVLEPLANRNQLAEKDRLFLARCWYFDGQLDKARSLLEQLEQDDYKDRTLFFTLGNIADKNGDVPTAISYWEKAVAIDSRYSEAMFNIGVGYYKINRRQKAIESWKKTLFMSPDAETRRSAEDAIASLQH